MGAALNRPFENCLTPPINWCTCRISVSLTLIPSDCEFRALHALPDLLLPVARHAVEGGDGLHKSPSPAAGEPINCNDDSDEQDELPGDVTILGNKRNRSPAEQSRSPDENRPPIQPVSTLNFS